jgi:serine/threonine protein kinase
MAVDMEADMEADISVGMGHQCKVVMTASSMDKISHFNLAVQNMTIVNEKDLMGYPGWTKDNSIDFETAQVNYRQLFLQQKPGPYVLPGVPMGKGRCVCPRIGTKNTIICKRVSLRKNEALREHTKMEALRSKILENPKLLPYVSFPFATYASSHTHTLFTDSLAYDCSEFSSILGVDSSLYFLFCVQLSVHLMDGVSTMNSLGIYHNDIKPQNIVFSLIDGCSIVSKFIDFGSSSTGAPDAHNTWFTFAGQDRMAFYGSEYYNSGDDKSSKIIDERRVLCLVLKYIFAGEDCCSGDVKDHKRLCKKLEKIDGRFKDLFKCLDSDDTKDIPVRLWEILKNNLITSRDVEGIPCNNLSEFHEDFKAHFYILENNKVTVGDLISTKNGPDWIRKVKTRFDGYMQNVDVDFEPHPRYICAPERVDKESTDQSTDQCKHTSDSMKRDTIKVLLAIPSSMLTSCEWMCRRTAYIIKRFREHDDGKNPMEILRRDSFVKLVYTAQSVNVISVVLLPTLGSCYINFMVAGVEFLKYRDNLEKLLKLKRLHKYFVYCKIDPLEANATTPPRLIASTFSGSLREYVQMYRDVQPLNYGKKMLKAFKRLKVGLNLVHEAGMWIGFDGDLENIMYHEDSTGKLNLFFTNYFTPHEIRTISNGLERLPFNSTNSIPVSSIRTVAINPTQDKKSAQTVEWVAGRDERYYDNQNLFAAFWKARHHTSPLFSFVKKNGAKIPLSVKFVKLTGSLLQGNYDQIIKSVRSATKNNTDDEEFMFDLLSISPPAQS